MSASVIVRPATNGRIWQVNLTSTEPIRWPWEAGAVFARLTITNHCNSTVTVHEVARSGNDAFGSFTLTIPEMPEEKLYSLVLEQFHLNDAGSERRLSIENARIVYLPGIDGCGITVKPVAKSGVVRGEENVVFAYDSAWVGDSSGVADLKLAWQAQSGASGERTLPGRSGFDVVSIGRENTTELSLFSGETLFCRARVRSSSSGFIVILR